MKHILVTGRPRTGKTTLMKRVIEDLDSCGGFYTEEIIENSQRVGFRIRTLDGKEGILAKKGLKTGFRLGSYGINLKDLEGLGVKAVEEALETKDIIIIDEIGKMELVSEKFKEAVLRALDSGKRLLGVIHIADIKFLNRIRERKDVAILEVSTENHDEVLRRIKLLLGSG